MKRTIRRIREALVLLSLLALLGVTALFAFLWLEHRTDVSLPTPTGPFAVGRALYDWTDDHSLDTLAPVPGTKRELLVWIWYPAAAGQSGAVFDDYLPASMRAPAARGGGSPIFKLLTRDLSKVHGHSLRNADVSPQRRSYAVVIMRAGASAPVVNYSTLAEDLASHGYVVVGFDAPYRTGVVVFPDGRVFTRSPENNPEVASADRIDKIFAAWTADIGFVLDRLEQLNASGKFAGRLDLTRVGVFGHSFGGAQALQFCHDDSRCKAGIDIDGAPIGSVIKTGVQTPFMFLLSDHGDFSSAAEDRQIMVNIQSIYDRLPPDGRLRIMIRGANHFTFSDDGALVKSRLVRGLLRMFGKLGIDGRRQLAVTAYCVRTFFDAYLENGKASRLNLSSPQYPEIRALE